MFSYEIIRYRSNKYNYCVGVFRCFWLKNCNSLAIGSVSWCLELTSRFVANRNMQSICDYKSNYNYF